MNIEEEIRDLKSYYGSENPGSLQKNTVMKIMKAGKFDKFLEQQGINVSDFVDQKLEKNTYVHNDVFSTKIRPWFKENDIEDTLVSLPSNNMYPQFVANGYDDYHNAFMMVPMIMVVGIFVGRYVYQKFMKKTPDKKKKCLQKKEQAKEEQNQEYCAWSRKTKTFKDKKIKSLEFYFYSSAFKTSSLFLPVEIMLKSKINLSLPLTFETKNKMKRSTVTQK